MLTALLIALQAETRLYHASLGTKGEPVLPFDFELVRKDDGAWTAG